MALVRWLAAIGVDGQLAFDIVLATSEAASNAIEHGHRCDGSRGIAVDVDLVGGVLRVRVRDAGRWRKPTPPGERGRGLPIMRALMDRVEIERSVVGTVVTMESRAS
jgi:anti-sigma regulatory factor (Ser/Thr protein kinase)